MKKRILFGLAGVAIMAAAVCATVSGVNSNSSDSDLLTKNLEALTNGEGGGYSCVAPYDFKCATEGTTRIPGVYW